MIKLYTTCPQSKDFPIQTYLNQITQVAGWSDEAQCTGMLIYSDNSIVDPWLVAQRCIEVTESLSPLVAVQPLYMHPYTVAKMVVSLTMLYGRRICLNMIAGGFKGDLIALGDPTEHDERYARLIEYTGIIQTLLRGDTSSLDGQYYYTSGLRLASNLIISANLMPEYLMSGSSPAGQAAAQTLGATVVEYPAPPDQTSLIYSDQSRGIRLGIIAHDQAEEAWRIAWNRFPEDRRGQLAHSLAMKRSDSVWHKRLSELVKTKTDENNPYWLWPFQNYQTFCPYLVGDVATVAAELSRYFKMGYFTLIVDIPRTFEDLTSINKVLRYATEHINLTKD